MSSKPVSSRSRWAPVATALAVWMGVGFSPLAGAAQPDRDGAADRPLTRAEVVADFKLWTQAGVDQYNELPLRDALAPRYLQALARYEALRRGPAFAQELARVVAQQAQ
jgi:hypothetical protein